MIKLIMWAFFGNAEDGPVGAGTNWNPLGETGLKRRVAWWLRNPAHNFTHHVIGLYGRDFESVILKNPPSGLAVSVRRYKGVNLYYYNMRFGGWQAYAGWRASGAFGLAIRRV